MKKDTYDSIPSRIKAERKRLALTQVEAAEKCEVTRVQWGRYERGESEFGGRVLRAFIALGADGQYILSGQRTSIEGTEVTVDILDAIDRSVVKLMAERQAELKRAIDQCMNYKKLMMIRYVLDMNDTEFAEFSEEVKRMESDAKENNDNKATSGVVKNHKNSVKGQQIGDNNQQHNHFASQQNSSINIENQHGGSIVGIKNK